LQNQYNNQLVALCGYSSYDSANNPLPDIFLAGLPPGDREAAGSQIISGYHLNQTGTIYQQWQSLEAAETRFADAQLQLSNTFVFMLVKKTIGDLVYSNQLNMAALILSNGQQISALDIQKGEIQAALDDAYAHSQHNSAENSAGTGLLGGIASGIFDNNWGQAVTDLGNAWGAYQQAGAVMSMGQSQADSARQLAAIDAQIQKISASEQAQMQYLNADTTMLNLSADLNALRLQAESQKVQIQLAAQNVDQERNKLATLFSQVSHLLKQYARSVNLLADNPKLSDDFLVARNNRMQEADDAFLLAQQWAFLTAQCFYYEDNCVDDLTSKTYLKNVLAARNTATLVANLYSMTSSNAALGFTCQSSPDTAPKEISLRNNVFQQNFQSGTNTIFEPVLIAGGVGVNAAASAAAWSNSLAQNLFSDQIGTRTLKLQFATSLNPQWVGGIPRNPLFERNTFGAVIDRYAAGNLQCAGVQVNIVTTGLQLAPTGVRVVLSQDGTSSLRSLGYCNPKNSFRFFNFGSFKNTFTASLNGFDSSLPGSSAFQDRSIANDLWTIAIVDDGGNGTTILNNLDKLQDIQIRFGFRSYTDQQCGP
jgi:hypothetical protein